MSSTSLADALAGGSKFVRWDDLGVGTIVTGTITDVEMRQARKYQSTDLDFWDDGKPKMQAIITLATDHRDPADLDDDGTRAISVNLWSGQRKALVDACKAAGVTEPQVGQKFTATWVSGVGKAGDPRVFEYQLTGAPASGLGDALAAAPADTTAAPVADPAAAAAALAQLTPEQRAALGLPA